MKENTQNGAEADPLLTLKQVRTRLGAGRTKVWHCCNMPNGLMVVRIGGLVRVRQSDLDDFINRHRK
jgi:predicted DNA-binding transcriptional regulator AlpA